ELVAHVLVEVTTGIIPEKSPVNVAVGIELVRRGVSLKRFPDNVLGGHVGEDGPRPLWLVVRRVAVHVRMNRSDLSDVAGGHELEGIGGLAHRASLMAD